MIRQQQLAGRRACEEAARRSTRPASHRRLFKFHPPRPSSSFRPALLPNSGRSLVRGREGTAAESKSSVALLGRAGFHPLVGVDASARDGGWTDDDIRPQDVAHPPPESSSLVGRRSSVAWSGGRTTPSAGERGSRKKRKNDAATAARRAACLSARAWGLESASTKEGGGGSHSTLTRWTARGCCSAGEG